MNLNEEIKKLADEYEPYIIDCRRKVHTFAEVAMQENKTHAFILEEAKKLGLPYEEVPTTSVIVKLDTGRPGMVVAPGPTSTPCPWPKTPTTWPVLGPASPSRATPATPAAMTPTPPCCWGPCRSSTE